MFKKVGFTLLVFIMLTGTAMAQQAELIYSVPDPQGDAYGPGEYTYPQDTSFPQQLPDMLDLVEFSVSNLEGATRFEFEFSQPPNLVQPWGGAGFNFHRIDLYISDGSQGSTETFRPGAQVQLQQPWQINLRIRDWGGAALIQWDDDPQDSDAGVWQDQIDGFEVYVEDNAIVADIDNDILPPASPDWRYYVLVGIQDAYGPDQYREVNEQPGPWTGGGGSDSDYNPNVYDILATSPEMQNNQLSWEPGSLATLQPVPFRAGPPFFRIIIIVGLVLIAAGIAAFIWIYRR